MRRWALAAPVAALALLSAARPASAQPAPAPSFGTPGQLVLSSDAQGSLEVQSGSAGGLQTTTITLGPAADLFVVRSLSLGARALWQHSQTSGVPDTDSLSAGVSVGYAVRMTEAFSFWPKVNIDYRHTSTRTVAAMTIDQEIEVHSDAMILGAFLPVLFHPVPHFFIGLGPNFQAAVLSSASTDTEYGLMFTLGGWLNLGS
jgi:hypothetical protein